MPSDRWGFNNWAKTYDQDVAKYACENDWMYKNYDNILDMVVDYCEIAKCEYFTVLDIGIGTGNLASRFLHKGLSVIGIDPSEEMRNVCRQKYAEIQILKGDFLNIPLPDKSIDLIVSSYAFHHLPSSEKEMAIFEMKHKLKPGGRIVIADLMFKNEAEEKREKQALIDSGNGKLVNELEEEYLSLFDTLCRSFSKAGFTVKGRQASPSVWIVCACL